MLADTESEKNKWIVALSELHRILKRNNLPNTTVVRIPLLLVKVDLLFTNYSNKYFDLDLQSKGTCR